MKNKILVSTVLLLATVFNAQASFIYKETDPYCSISGTTHTSFPGEISDTSSWSIPTAYQSACDSTLDLEQSEKDRIYNIMIEFFDDKDYIGPVYGWSYGYGWEDTLNPEGQKYINEIFFPLVILYIQKERIKQNPNTKNIAILNYAVKNIWYDYFISQAQ